MRLSFVVIAFSFAMINGIIDSKVLQINPPTLEYTCGFFSYFTFSYLTRPLIQLGLTKDSLDLNDVPTFVDEDSAEQIYNRFKTLQNHQQKKKLDVFRSLFILVRREWFHQGFFQFLASCSGYFAPIALERILLHINNNGQDDDQVKAIFPISVEMAVFLLFFGPALKCICDGQNYMRGR
jgi:hypothetical protein